MNYLFIYLTPGEFLLILHYPTQASLLSHDIFSAPPELTTHFLPSRTIVPWSHPRNYVWLMCPFRDHCPALHRAQTAHKKLPYILEVSTFTWINLYLILSLGINLPALTHPQLLACILALHLDTLFMCCKSTLHSIFPDHCLFNRKSFSSWCWELLPQAALTGADLIHQHGSGQFIFIWFSSFLWFHSSCFMGQGELLKE